MKITIDCSIKKITKVEQSPIYFGNNNVDKIVLSFINTSSISLEWYPSLSAVGPDKNPIYPRSYDTDGITSANGITNYDFTLSNANGWNLIAGKHLFYVWINYPDTNGNECVGSFACTILASSGYYMIDNTVVNPSLRQYLENSFEEHYNDVDARFEELQEDFHDEYEEEVNAQRSAINNLIGGQPRYVNTSSNILALTTNKGIAAGTDTQKWYYWNGSQYVVGGDYPGVAGYDELNEDLAKLMKTSNNLYNDKTDTAGAYISSSGVEMQDANLKLSDYIEIPFNGDNYIYINSSNLASAYSDYKGIMNYSLYDENKTFIARASMVTQRISGFNNSSNNAKYLRLNIGVNSINLMVVIKNTYDSTYNPDYAPFGFDFTENSKEKINSVVEKKYKSITENSSEKPLQNLIYNGGLTGIFRTIGVVGDSLSSGCMELAGGTGGVDMYEHSWIQHIGRICGSTAYNFSAGGLKSKSFWTTNNQKIKNLRDKDSNYKCTAYFIALGVNDIADNTIEVGTSSDIDNDDSTTFYGYYSRIIKLIQEVQPKAKIFLVGLPNHPNMTVWGARFTNFKNAIADMVNHFDNCYYLDLFTYDVIYDDNFKAIYFNGFHENALGYLRTSWVISSYVDWIIRHNYEDFREVGFIGTDYHYYN